MKEILGLNQENCILITNEKNWVEQAAKDQLCGVGRLPGVIKAVGLPDLHPGKTPVGMAVLSQGRFYPHLIGNDIGCGMSLFKTSRVSAEKEIKGILPYYLRQRKICGHWRAACSGYAEALSVQSTDARTGLLM